MIYNNGDKIEGKWINDKLEGYVIMKYNNVDIFEGYWKNNLKEGKGNLKVKMKMNILVYGKMIF